MHSLVSLEQTFAPENFGCSHMASKKGRASHDQISTIPATSWLSAFSASMLHVASYFLSCSSFLAIFFIRMIFHNFHDFSFTVRYHFHYCSLCFIMCHHCSSVLIIFITLFIFHHFASFSYFSSFSVIFCTFSLFFKLSSFCYSFFYDFPAVGHYSSLSS